MNFEDNSYVFYENSWDNFTIENEKRAKRKFFRVFFGLFVYLLVSQLAAIAIETAIVLTGAQYIFKSPYFLLGINVLCMYVIALPVFLLCMIGVKGTVRYKTKLSAKEFFALFLVCQAGTTIGSYISEIINTVLAKFRLSSDGVVSEIVTESPLWLIFAVVVVLGPIVEEFIFRKILMDKLGVYGDRLAILVSAIAFGLFHGNIGQFFYATIIGLILGYVYAKTGKLIYTVLLHMLMNFFGSILPLTILKISELLPLEDILVALENYIENGTTLDPELFKWYTIPLTLAVSFISLISIAASIAGFIILLKNIKRIYVSDRCDVLIPKEKRAGIIFKNAGVILFLVLCIITFVRGTPLYEDLITPGTNTEDVSPDTTPDIDPEVPPTINPGGGSV